MTTYLVWDAGPCMLTLRRSTASDLIRSLDLGSLFRTFLRTTVAISLLLRVYWTTSTGTPLYSFLHVPDSAATNVDIST